MVYFGPPDAEAISHHMPMDGGLQHATVEGKENATAAAADHGDKVRLRLAYKYNPARHQLHSKCMVAGS